MEAEADLDDPLSMMPLRVIRRFRAASWAATACVFVVIVVLIGTPGLALPRPAKLGLLAGVSLLWCGAAWLLTPAFDLPQAVQRGFGRRGRLRAAARGLQLGWVVAAGAGWVAAAVPAGAAGRAPLALLSALAWLGAIAGLAGVVTLTVLLQRLAEWARDGDAERALNLTLWGTPIMSLALVIGSNVRLFFVVLAAMFILWLICVAALPYALLSLSKSMWWTVRHAHEYHARMRRQRERAERRTEELAGPLAQADTDHRDQERAE